MTKIQFRIQYIEYFKHVMVMFKDFPPKWPQLNKAAQHRPKDSPIYYNQPPPEQNTDLGCQSFQCGCRLWAPLSRDPEALRLITF